MSIFDRAKTVGLFEGAAGSNNTLHNIKPEEKLTGDNLIVNGDFSQDAGGTGGLLQVDVYDGAVGWNLSNSPQADQVSKITDGKLIMETGANANALAYAHNGTNRDILTENATYKLTYTVKSISGSNVSLRAYWDAGYRTIDNEVGTHSVTFVHTRAVHATPNKLFLFSLNSANAHVEIDDVSIFKVEERNSDFKFFRGSNLTATRVNKDGLIEKGRENLFTYSNDFDNDIWVGSSTWTSGQSGYDGSTNAWSFNKSSATGSDYYTKFFSGLHTFSIYAKKQSNAGLAIYAFYDFDGSSFGGNKRVIYDLSDGTAVYQSSIVSTTSEAVGDDWWRITMTVDRDDMRWYLYTTDGTQTLVDNVTVTLQDAQLEVGLVATEYMHSERSTGLGGIREDEPRFDYTGGGCPKLLMEMGSVNKQTYSEYLSGWNTLNLSLTTNAAKSPEGLNNASKIVESTDTGLHRFSKQWTFVDGTIYSLSFFAKAAGRNKIEVKYGTNTVANFHATFTLDGTDPVNSGDGTASMQAMGDGWYRCKIENIEGHRLDTGNIHGESVSTAFNVMLHDDSSPTTNSYEGDGSSGVLIYGFQQEEKPFATSYIPTHGAEGTRAMDNNIDDAVPAHSYDLNKSWSLFVDLGETKKDLSLGSQGFIDLETDDSTKRVSLYVNDNETNAGLNLYLGTANPPNNGYVFSSSPNDAFGADNSSVCASYDHTNYRLTYYINGDLYGYQATELNMGDSDSGGGRFRVNTGFLVNVKKYLFFEEALSDTEAAILTGTSYDSFGAMVDALTNYTTYE